MQQISREHLDSAFSAIFLDGDPTNPNSVQHPRGAAVVYDALVAAVNQTTRKDVLRRLHERIPFEQGNILDWNAVCKALGDAAPGVIAAAQFLLLYPRLDEHVSTRRDHLLKLPFCVHPGTGSLCCPLMWDALHDFDPNADAPKLSDLLLSRSIEPRWKRPLLNMLADMAADPGEALGLSS
jgi:DNA primase small subunit